MIHNMLTIFAALAQSPLVMFFGLIAVIFTVSYAIVRILHLQENFS